MENKKCPMCDRELTPQGFGGHMWGVHGIRTGEHAKLADVNKRVAKLEETVPGSVAKLQEDAQNRLTKLEAWMAEMRIMHTAGVKLGIDDGKHTGMYGVK